MRKLQEDSPEQWAESSVATMEKGGPELGVIDQAYGDFVDLYSDVLRVSVAASDEQIQMAYFDRRSELFTALAKMDARSQQDEKTMQERLETERKMDSVVLAVRILGDPDQRLAYDQTRQSRLLNRRRAEQGHLPGHKAQVRGLDSGMEMAGVEEEDQQPEVRRSLWGGLRRKSKKKKRGGAVDKENILNDTRVVPTASSLSSRGDRSSLAQQETRDTDDNTTRQEDGDTTVYTYDSQAADDNAQKESYLSCISHSRILRNLAKEISESCEDTLVSVDQVFNAFTLTDKDIKAVTRRIDRAKRELDS